MAADNSFEELLRVSRNKRSLGDTYSQVLQFLKGRGADENTIRDIITLLKEEEEQARVLAASVGSTGKGGEKESGPWGIGLLGLFLLVLGLIVTFGYSEVLFGDVDPQGGYGKNRLGHFVLYLLSELDGFLRYSVGFALTGVGVWALFTSYMKYKHP